MASDWQYDAERERQIAERNDVAMQQVVASVMCDKYDVAYLLGALAAAREALADMVSIAHNEGWHLRHDGSNNIRRDAYYRAERALGREIPHEEPNR